MRPVDDQRELLELHLQEQEEISLRDAIIDCFAELMEYRIEEERTGIDWSIERDWLRHEISILRKAERKAQRVNGTQLVLDPDTYDREAGDEIAEVTDWDLDRLAYHGITVPAAACSVTPLHPREYARRAMWEGL